MPKALKTCLFLAALLLVWLAGIFFFFPGWVYDGAVLANRWRAGLGSAVVSANGTRWAYLSGGQGETVLLLHGFGADKDHFGPFLCAFRDRYRLIVPDLPGFGASSREMSLAYDIPNQAARLKDFIQALGLKRFHLAGVSMGGYLAAYYAAHHPAEVKSLLLMAPAGVSPPVPGKLEATYDREGRILLLYRSPEEFDDLMGVIFHSPPWVPGPIKRYLVDRHRHDYALRAKILSDMLAGGMTLLEGRLERIACPTLVLWGREDQVVPAACLARFVEEIPRSRGVMIDNCGHVPYLEKSARTTALYQDFLESFD